ncbi:hypothetical protein ACFWAY_39125 [Rhodococcus sp. NPDC059968]|uniref:hypothetical protein n=1 Tax=Rhodococcus sp. NPDC059968 TaxID=3347017 RepID=UPI00366DCE0A
MTTEQDITSNSEKEPRARRGARRRVKTILGAIVHLPRKSAFWVNGWPRRRRNCVAIVLSVMVVAGAVGCVALYQKVDERGQTQAAGDSASSQIPGRLESTLSYDYRSVESDLASATDNLTGDFRKEFESLGKEIITPVARDREVVTAATVVESSVVSANPGEVTILAFVNQTTTRKDAPEQRLDGSRVRVRATERDGQWLISEITPL